MGFGPENPNLEFPFFFFLFLGGRIRKGPVISRQILAPSCSLHSLAFLLPVQLQEVKLNYELSQEPGEWCLRICAIGIHGRTLNHMTSLPETHIISFSDMSPVGCFWQKKQCGAWQLSITMCRMGVLHSWDQDPPTSFQDVLPLLEQKPFLKESLHGRDQGRPDIF